MMKYKPTRLPALIKTPLCLIAVSALASIICGFNWGFRKEPCDEAAKLYAVSPNGMSEPLSQQLITLCPDGAVGHLAKGYQFEQNGAISRAVNEYQKATDLDATLGQAHGRLGLLQLQQGADVAAAAELTKALMSAPDPRYHRGLAMLLNKEGGTSLVIFHAIEALKGNPDDAEVRIWLADAYAGKGELDRATEEYAKVLAKKANNEHARLGLGGIYEKRGKLDDAIHEYSAAALSNPSNKSIHKLLAEMYQQKGDKALADKELVLAGFNPKEADIKRLIQKGDELLLARNYDKAIETYQAIVKTLPDRPDLLEKLGDAQMAAGRDDEAIKAYRQAITLDQSNASLYYTLGILYERKGLLDEAETEYEKSLQHDPKNGDPRRRLADIYTLRGNFTQSIAEYIELIKLRGDNPILHFRLARVYDKNKEFKNAIASYQTAVKLAPDNVEIRKELAALYGKRGMNDEAELQYHEILRLDRNDNVTRNILLSIYVKRKKYDGLLTLLKDAVDMNPNDANSHYKLGIVYDFQKEYEAASTEYQKAIELNPNHAKALNAYGRLCIKAGKLEKAKGLLEAARTADPSFTEPRELLSNIREETKPARIRKGTRKSNAVKRGSKSREKPAQKKHNG